MFDLDSIIDEFLEQVRKIFFLEDWVQLDLKFSKSEIFTMLYLDRRKELTMTELVEYINSPMSTATGIADRLVRSGYIRRERSESDRRVVILALTEKGFQLVKSMKDLIHGYIDTALEGITEEETMALAGIAFKILGNLQKKRSKDASGGVEEADIKKIEIE